VDNYNVYLGVSETGVANADTNSPLFLGTHPTVLATVESLTPDEVLLARGRGDAV